MARELTAKQEKFCQGVAVKSLSLSNAYREAYEADKMTPEGINTNACKLSKQTNIALRITSLKASILDSLKEEIIYSRKQSFNKFNEIQKEAKLNKQYSVATKNEELKGKLCGFYEDVHRIKGDKNNPVQHKITVNFVKK